MNESNDKKMTAEDVKKVVSQYAKQQFPGGWVSAAVVINVANDRPRETLLVLPAD